MKKILLIIIIIFPSLINSQNNVLKNKLEKTNSRLDSLEAKQHEIELPIKELKYSLEQSKLKSDSLKSELLFYKVKEDYYASALSDQSTRFTLIISGILALFAIISFGAFKFEVARIQKESNNKYFELQAKFEKYSTKLSKNKKTLVSATGNLNITIATLFKKEKKHGVAFFYYILGARDHGKASKKDDKFKVAINNLEYAMDSLKNCKADSFVEFENELNVLSKAFDKISAFKNETVKVLIAEIRVLYNKTNINKI